MKWVLKSHCCWPQLEVFISLIASNIIGAYEHNMICLIMNTQLRGVFFIRKVRNLSALELWPGRNFWQPKAGRKFRVMWQPCISKLIFTFINYFKGSLAPTSMMARTQPISRTTGWPHHYGVARRNFIIRFIRPKQLFTVAVAVVLRCRRDWPQP